MIGGGKRESGRGEIVSSSRSNIFEPAYVVVTLLGQTTLN